MCVYIYVFSPFVFVVERRKTRRKERIGEKRARGGFGEGHGQQERRNIFGRLNEVHK